MNETKRTNGDLSYVSLCQIEWSQLCLVCMCLHVFLSRSRSVVRVGIRVIFEPSKVNVFNKDCVRAGREVSCMLATVCLNVTAQTPMSGPKTVGVWLCPSVRRKSVWCLFERSLYHQILSFSLSLQRWGTAVGLRRTDISPERCLTAQTSSSPQTSSFILIQNTASDSSFTYMWVMNVFNKHKSTHSQCSSWKTALQSHFKTQECTSKRWHLLQHSSQWHFNSDKYCMFWGSL